MIPAPPPGDTSSLRSCLSFSGREEGSTSMTGIAGADEFVARQNPSKETVGRSVGGSDKPASILYRGPTETDIFTSPDEVAPAGLDRAADGSEAAAIANKTAPSGARACATAQAAAASQNVPPDSSLGVITED